MRRVVGEIKDIPQLGNTEGQMGAAARKLSLGREALQAPAAPVLGDSGSHTAHVPCEHAVGLPAISADDPSPLGLRGAVLRGQGYIQVVV